LIFYQSDTQEYFCIRADDVNSYFICKSPNYIRPGQEFFGLIIPNQELPTDSDIFSSYPSSDFLNEILRGTCFKTIINPKLTNWTGDYEAINSTSCYDKNNKLLTSYKSFTSFPSYPPSQISAYTTKVQKGSDVPDELFDFLLDIPTLLDYFAKDTDSTGTGTAWFNASYPLNQSMLLQDGKQELHVIFLNDIPGIVKNGTQYSATSDTLVWFRLIYYNSWSLEKACLFIDGIDHQQEEPFADLKLSDECEVISNRTQSQ
jgi:hypothetical protein